jgi:hypothetical protein
MKEKRVNFIGNFFTGVGLGLTFAYESKLLICFGTFLCFHFYIEIYLGKK